jgi:hypothetical protein
MTMPRYASIDANRGISGDFVGWAASIGLFDIDRVSTGLLGNTADGLDSPLQSSFSFDYFQNRPAADLPPLAQWNEK